MSGKDALISYNKNFDKPELPDLRDLIDIKSLEKLLEDFHQLTGLGCSLVDAGGNVLAGVGRQSICKDFHWTNPISFENCRESDLNITSELDAGEFKISKCKNNLWDVTTPIIIENQHIGNLFLGQFLVDEEPVNKEIFIAQARKFGFDEKGYLEALDEAPRLSRSRIVNAMNLVVRFANIISDQSMHSGLIRKRPLMQVVMIILASQYNPIN